MATKVTEPEETISESYISIGLGLLVVVVVGILLYNYFTQKQAQPEPSPEEEITEQAASAQPGAKYVVKEGDTLWSISETAYGTGFNWQDIQKANNLPEDVALEPGQELVIPEVTPTQSVEPVASAEALPEVSPVVEAPKFLASPAPQETISGNSYTVVAGDTLWDIACRAYGDCFAWSKIAQENKLINPDLIHPGNVFTLPR